MTTTYTPTRPVMTRAELATHHIRDWGRDYRESDDGWSDMEAEGRRGWRVISGWGRDGWDLGDWPYVAIYTRTTNPGTMTDGKLNRVYELLQVVEGDRSLWTFTSTEDRRAAIDYLFLWYAADDLPWVDREKLDAGQQEIGVRFRGPYRDESKEAS
jgi:hypothetical protein